MKQPPEVRHRKQEAGKFAELEYEHSEQQVASSLLAKDDTKVKRYVIKVQDVYQGITWCR